MRNMKGIPEPVYTSASKLSSADLNARSSGKRTKVGQSKINMHLFSKEETGEKLSRTSGNKR